MAALLEMIKKGEGHITQVEFNNLVRLYNAEQVKNNVGDSIARIQVGQEVPIFVGEGIKIKRSKGEGKYILFLGNTFPIKDKLKKAGLYGFYTKPNPYKKRQVFVWSGAWEKAEEILKALA